MTDIEIKLAKLNGVQDETYEKLVVEKIRKRYSASAELAILRKYTRDSELYKEEFEEYDTYAEQCKAEAKAAVYGE